MLRWGTLVLRSSLITLILLSALTASPYAATLTAANCSLSAVQSAISSAVSGDTVIVPAGSASWTAQLTISKGIKLQGAGVGNTVITSNCCGARNGLIVYS